MRPHRDQAARNPKVRQRLAVAWRHDPGLYDTRRPASTAGDEGARQCRPDRERIRAGLLRDQARLALQHQYVGEYRQPKPPPQLPHPPELSAERLGLHQGAAELRPDHLRLATAFASPRLHAKNIETDYFKKNEFNADIFSLPPEKGRM